MLPIIPVVNLVQSSVSLPALDASRGAYCGMLVRFAPATRESLPPAAPQALLLHSLVIAGHRADGVSVLIAGDGPAELELVSEGAFLIDAERHAILLTFNFSALFDGVDLASAMATGGQIVVDEARNTDLFELIYGNFPPSVELRRDHDADGMLDEEDRTAHPLALAR